MRTLFDQRSSEAVSWRGGRAAADSIPPSRSPNLTDQDQAAQQEDNIQNLQVRMFRYIG